MGQRHGRVRFCAVHTSDTREFCFKVKDRGLIGITLIEVTEGAFEQMKDLRFVMLDLGADFDQLDKIRRGLRAPMISSNSYKCIGHHNSRKVCQVDLPLFAIDYSASKNKFSYPGKGLQGAL